MASKELHFVLVVCMISPRLFVTLTHTKELSAIAALGCLVTCAVYVRKFSNGVLTNTANRIAFASSVMLLTARGIHFAPDTHNNLHA